MVQIAGKYQYISNENFEEFVNAMGQKEMAAPFLVSKPVVEISQNGDQWTVVISSDEKSSSTTFKLNEPYEECLPSFDRKFPSITTQDSDNLRTVTTLSDSIKITRLYKFTETGMSVQISASTIDVTAVRTYKRL